MPRSSGGRLLAEIGVGGHGRRNIVNDENQNWWCQVFFDPSHRIRILLRPAFLKSNGPVCVERPSKADCLRLKIYYSGCLEEEKPEPLSD